MSSLPLFDINNSSPQEILSFYDDNGVVIITGILNRNEIDETIKDIENIIKLNSSDEFSFNDKKTYHLADSYLNNYGVLGKEPLFTKTLLHNRLHKNVQKAYSIVYNCEIEELTACHDRVAWMRPTLDECGNYDSTYDTPYEYPGLHLDVDPNGYFTKGYETTVRDFLNSITYKSKGDYVRENNAKHVTMGKRLQGVINLFDNDYYDGGFHCFLGGHNMLKDWYEQVKDILPEPEPNGKYIFKASSRHDSVFFDTERAPCPAGSIIIFDATLPHGTQPNRSSKNRMIQFLRYEKKATFGENYERRKNNLLKICSEIKYTPTKDELKTL